ncbi:MAG: hypothetical protein LBT20_03815 [Clostridiales bacterium]|jgi:hypothetical protein|nr:hypothetical protein [Clostridiales bacterium]
MDYSDIKRLDTVLTENNYFENRIGKKTEAETTEGLSAPAAVKKPWDFKLPHLNFRMSFAKGFMKSLKGKFDIYDAIMIPVGIGILAAFVMLILKVI